MRLVFHEDEPVFGWEGFNCQMRCGWIGMRGLREENNEDGCHPGMFTSRFDGPPEVLTGGHNVVAHLGAGLGRIPRFDRRLDGSMLVERQSGASLAIWLGRIVEALNDPLLEIVPGEVQQVCEDGILGSAGDRDVEGEVGFEKTVPVVEGGRQVVDGRRYGGQMIRLCSLRGGLGGLTFEH